MVPSALRLLLACLLPLAVAGQGISFDRAYPNLTRAGRDLPLAWFGGLNTPQTHATDLDGDGTPDLYIFDKAGEVQLALRGDGAGHYTPAPDLVAHFPTLEGWVVVRDYNGDGVADLFAYDDTVSGVAVYRGRRRADGLLAFDRLDFGDPLPILYFPLNDGRTNLFVSRIDYPGVADVDGDGDLDILTFAINGGYLEYYQNQSVERGYGRDTLIYTLADECWGGFFESGLTTALDLAPSPGECATNFAPGGGGRPRHSGSSVTVLDYDGNGQPDIMLGDVSFDRLVLGLNHGTTDEAWISEQDSAWNDGGVIADITSFPAAYPVDLDQDGLDDLIGSPSVVLNGSDVEVMWWYRNVGTAAAPSYEFQTRTALVEDMVDVGTSANVTVFDYDADGRPDLVVGNNDEFTPDNSLDSRLRLLRNVTPPGGPVAFALIDEDYLGMSDFQNTGWAFAPTFGDLDGDGDLDVVIGDRSGKLFYGRNTAGAGNEATFAPLVFQWQDIDAGQFSKPFLADLDRDGLLDLLVGGFDGRVRFYRNVGSATEPAFAADPGAPGNALQLGAFSTNRPGVSTGHPAPWVLQNDDYTLVLAGNRTGSLEAYRFGIDSSYLDPYATVSRDLGGLDVGGFANPAFGDFDGDGLLELVLGTQRGGLNYFTTNLTADGTTGLFTPAAPTVRFDAWPNPATEIVTLSGWPAGQIDELTLLDLTGRVLRQTRVDGARTQVQWRVAGLAAGAYVVRATGRGGVGALRVVVR